MPLFFSSHACLCNSVFRHREIYDFSSEIQRVYVLNRFRVANISACPSRYAGDRHRIETLLDGGGHLYSHWSFNIYIYVRIRCIFFAYIHIDTQLISLIYVCNLNELGKLKRSQIIGISKAFICHNVLQCSEFCCMTSPYNTKEYFKNEKKIIGIPFWRRLLRAFCSLDLGRNIFQLLLKLFVIHQK